MKTIDVFELKNGIDQTLNKLKQQSQNVKSLEKQINQIISLDSALKGEAGQAIKDFYMECHIPFLQFFQIVIEEYSGALKKTKQALHAFESNPNGFISQSFIEQELDQGLKKAERTISDIVSDVNQAIGRVNHIVHLPHVDESTFQQSYQKAWLETSKTIGLLHAFDREQTSALNETKSALHTMKQYIDTLSKMFTGPKIEITSYQKGSIFKDGKEEKISSNISGLNKKIDDPKENPMTIMLNKLNDKEQSNVDTLVKKKPSNKINQNAVFVNGKVYNTNEKIDFANAKTVEVIRDGMLYRLRITDQNKVNIESITKISDLKQTSNILYTAVEFTGINDAIRVITGRDPVTGDKVADMDRLVSSLYMIPGAKIAKVGKYVFKIMKGEKGSKKIVKTPSFGKHSVPKGPYREVNGFPVKVKPGAQEKHISDAPNYKQEVANGKTKSIFYGDNKKAQELLDKFAGKGDMFTKNRERINFGQVIGKYYDHKSKTYVETTNGLIHYGKDGAHIVPARP
ncbi:T7SS effector LXG polymorphic toxin [Bacillus pumilus]|uniref:Transposase n=1 Tax=Bacillus pumilus (strain SAFR-032) TaxID=315750 RepID=A8FFY0_BACP2|nr:T7SS effector LXG polymorphic toxin [Bacillus pumilus]ABV63147.1 transposase [Bacillus pumilus SAFR-032]AVI41864.1 transposase [Bacillus pumilus]MBC3643291.1 transposase [Bacillus pumilus]MBC3645740.1 transposase [Bacillus pumilus]MBC3649264.1 transposase [Bacillus pumilus]